MNSELRGQIQPETKREEWMYRTFENVFVHELQLHRWLCGFWCLVGFIIGWAAK